MVEVGETAPSILLVTRARNSLHVPEPVLTAHSHREVGCSFEAQRTQREDAFSGESVRGRFSRSLKASSSNYLRRYGLLMCPGNYPGQIKKFHLCDLSDSAVKAIYFVLPLIVHLLKIFVKMDGKESRWRD
jgi:hypothetical protein